MKTVLSITGSSIRGSRCLNTRGCRLGYTPGLGPHSLGPARPEVYLTDFEAFNRVSAEYLDHKPALGDHEGARAVEVLTYGSGRRGCPARVVGLIPW